MVRNPQVGGFLENFKILHSCNEQAMRSEEPPAATQPPTEYHTQMRWTGDRVEYITDAADGHMPRGKGKARICQACGEAAAPPQMVAVSFTLFLKQKHQATHVPKMELAFL